MNSSSSPHFVTPLDVDPFADMPFDELEHKPIMRQGLSKALAEDERDLAELEREVDLSEIRPEQEGAESVGDPFGGAREDAEALPSRRALFKRLADVVCLPESRINSFERSVTADLLLDMLKEASVAERERVARRVASLSDIPHNLARVLLIDIIEVASPLLENAESLSDAELVYCAKYGSTQHRVLLALRKNLPMILSESLIENGEPRVLEALLRNQRSVLSPTAIETIVALSQTCTALVPLIIKRPELRPSSAYVMFWWAPSELRRFILTRFGVSRDILQDMASDVFAMAAKENWQDPISRKALQFIERRQRNREALKKSPFTSLEVAIAEAARIGLNRQLTEEISYLAGIKPATGAKILRDASGEGLAILCKATGLPKKALKALWMGLRRPVRTENGDTHESLATIYTTYDMLAVDRAQTVLRYWNWSLTSGLSLDIIEKIKRGEKIDLARLSVPERTAVLAFTHDLKKDES
jgi:uncharacterized protein (DUF2336 family)